MFSTYLATIPQATDVPANSQAQILDNFTSLNEQFGVDHVPLIQGSSQGWHNQCTWLDQSAASPAPTSLAGQCIAYANKLGSVTQPYYQRDAAATVFPLSPIKAVANYQIGVGFVGDGSPLSGCWNIKGVTVVTNTNQNLTLKFTVLDASPMRTSTYAVLMSTSQLPGLSGSATYYANGASAIDQNNFQVTIACAAPAILNIVNVIITVAVLEF